MFGKARALQLDRQTDHTQNPIPLELDTSHQKFRQGMSPKKSHEVDRLAHLVRTLATPSASVPLPSSAETKPSPHHIVDVGAGQGYLSCDLAFPSDSLNVTQGIANSEGPAQLNAAHKAPFRVLALENNEVQLRGAKKRAGEHTKETPSEGSVVFESVWISQSQDLSNAVEQWVQDSSVPKSGLSEIPAVMFTGLHACGSLTPTVLRGFIDFASSTAPSSSGPKWSVGPLALVGCCYNLLNPSGTRSSFASGKRRS
ncbi:hypothetical protein DL93DRAFT_108015 [Clavulina sp. PMI_390]|nr:hypothetical protein DL93DRAFT_108015 [Clavulina sp. PMI_390]